MVSARKRTGAPPQGSGDSVLDNHLETPSYLFNSSRRGRHDGRLLSIGLNLDVDGVVGVDSDGLVPGHPGGGGRLPGLLAVGRVEGRLSAQPGPSQPVLGRRVSQK